MIKKTITYTDYNGTTRTEDFYFNLSQIDLLKMTAEGGNLQKRAAEIQSMAEALEQRGEVDDALRMDAVMKTVDMIGDLVSLSYGVKSEDGRRFTKNKELTEAFKESEAYGELVFSLMNDTGNAFLSFIRGIMPSNVASSIPENMTPEEAKARLAALTAQP